MFVNMRLNTPVGVRAMVYWSHISIYKNSQINRQTKFNKVLRCCLKIYSERSLSNNCQLTASSWIKPEPPLSYHP